MIGGAGFIGQSLISYMLQDGHEVVVIDDLSTSPPLRTHMDCVQLVMKSAQHLNDLCDYVQWADVVYFLAGSVGVDRVVNAPYATTKNNMELAVAVVDACRQYNKYVVYFSTSEVYHNGPYVEDSTAIIPTDSVRWSYASTKLSTEMLIMSAGIPYKILRLFNITGPGQLGRYGMVLPRFIEAAKSNVPIKVTGSGEQVRSFMHVADACNMIRAIEHVPTSGTYNIGSPLDSNITTITNLAIAVVTTLNSSSPIVRCDSEVVYGIKCGDIDDRRPNMTKTMSAISHKSQYDLQQIIEDMAQHD